MEIERLKEEIKNIKCGSGNSNHKAYHVISAFVAENQITLGEVTVEKNE